MSQLQTHHQALDENGVGRCSVPMCSGGCPSGFCDQPAYGERPPGETRRYAGGELRLDGRYSGYVPALACPDHGGPEAHALVPTQNKNARGRSHSGIGRLTCVAALVVSLATVGADAAKWPRPRWASHGGVDTRARVLAARCREVTWQGRHVAHAVCKDFYTGLEVATDDAPHALQIDHLLPAFEAWRRRAWTKDEFTAFFNDEDNLQVTRARTNERKGDLLPDRWCPSSRGARMVSAVRYHRVAVRYHLNLTAAEETGLRAWAAGSCSPGARVLGSD